MTDLSNLKSLDSSSSIFKDMFDRSFVSGMPIAGAQISFPESGRGLGHVTRTIFGIRSNISLKILELESRDFKFDTRLCMGNTEQAHK